MSTGSEPRDARRPADAAREAAAKPPKKPKAPKARKTDAAGAPVPERESSWRRGMRRMEEGGAFDVNDGVGLEGFARAERLMADDRRRMRRKVLICAAVLAVLLACSLCLTVSVQRVMPPGEVLGCVALWFQVQWTRFFTTDVPLSTLQIMELQPRYFEVTSRFSISVLTALCGAMLALAGALYQYVFKNPIAAPTMLGVQSGVNVGIVILVLTLGTGALYATGARYLLCYGCAAAILLVVLLSGRLIGGRGTFNVVNMLIVGSIVSQIAGTVITYITNLYMSTQLYEVYFEVQEQLNVDASVTSWIALFVAFAVSFAPIAAARFGMNALSMADDDARMLGVNVSALRIAALLSGSIMVTAATVYCGTVSMVSLLVPHIARALFGAEFRKQLVGNMLLGAILLLLCRDIVAIVPFLDTGIPIGTAVTWVTMPFFVWMLAVQQRSWE